MNLLLEGETIGRADGCELDELPDEADDEEGNLHIACNDIRKEALVILSKKLSSCFRERALCNVSSGRIVGTLQYPSKDNISYL